MAPLTQAAARNAFIAKVMKGFKHDCPLKPTEFFGVIFL
tara:strand:+ start:993 stop:1109 length:117 start_codon:yes stop_codon:yes gene_type:complete